MDLVKLIGLSSTNVKLLYQSSRDEFDNSRFHYNCGGVGNTLTVIKSKNSNIFGGFTSADWSDHGHKSDPTAFLFSLVNGFSVSVKMNVRSDGNNAIYSSTNYSIGFGEGGYDLRCDNDKCESNLGLSYKLPNFLKYGSNGAQSFLGGSSDFQAVEIEVYWIDRN